MDTIKANKNRIAIIAFLVLLVWVWLVGIFIFVFNHDYYVETTQTEGENRAAAVIEIDQLWDSGESISSFVDDKIPFRNVFIKIYKKFNGRIDSSYQKVASKIGAYFYMQEASIPEVVPNEIGSSDTSIEQHQDNASELVILDPNLPEDLGCYLAPVVVNDVLIGRRNFLFMYGENSINYYIGNNLLDDETLELYAAKVNKLKELCDAKGKELYMIFPPNKDQVYPWLMPTIEVETDYKRTARLADYLNEHTSVPVTYPLDKLKEMDNTWEQYYKFDSHWDTIGAFTGVQCLYEKMGVEMTDPFELTGEYHGAANYDLAVMAGMDVTTIGDQGEYCVDYRTDITVEGMDLDGEICRTISNSTNDKHFVLIGDSFRTAMIQYLTKDFSRCTIGHRNSIKDMNDDILSSDIIVIEAVERQDFEAFDVVDYLITLLQ